MYVGGTKLPYRPGLHHLNHTPRFRFHFGNLLDQILPPPIYKQTILLIQRPFLCVMYLKLKACESCASPFFYLGNVYI